jgi:hypothetical protein
MSQKELQRVKVIENAAGGRLSVREASRQVFAERKYKRQLSGASSLFRMLFQQLRARRRFC